MERQRFGIRLILISVGLSLLLAVSIAVFLSGNPQAKILVCVATLLILFISLIYFQLKFYREGDRKNIRNHRELPSMDLPSAPHYLKSPHHRAIWQNMEQSRALMRHKEKEAFQALTTKEKRRLRLPQEEIILFMADRSRFCCWPAPLLSLILLFVAAISSKESPVALSFVCLILGLFGLLLSTAATFGTRYYLTNLRILIRKKRPFGKTRWSTVNYAGIATIARQKKYVLQELTLGTDRETLVIRGLPKQKFRIAVDILRQKLSTSQSSSLEFYM
jgi:hypothetical protein